MRDFARKLATTIRPSMALPGEAEAQVAAMKNILHTAIARKKNIDPRKLLAWLESGQDFSEVSEAPPLKFLCCLRRFNPKKRIVLSFLLTKKFETLVQLLNCGKTFCF